MKRLINFDKFNKNENSMNFANTPNLYTTNYMANDTVEKTTTSTPEEKIKKEIDECIQKYNDNIEEFKKYNVDELRENLLKKAKDNKFRGKVTIRKSHDDPRSYHSGKKFIIYVPGMSTMQKVGKIVANE
jgi:hypothetical protein